MVVSIYLSVLLPNVIILMTLTVRLGALRNQSKRDIFLVELSLVLTSGLGLLLTLQAGADVMLALLNFSDDALLGAATLKATQSAFQRFVFLDANFRHCFPSLRWHPASSRMRSGLV